MPYASQYRTMNHQISKLPGSVTRVPNRPLRTRLLLAEAGTESLSTRNLLLSQAGYQLATASTRKEVFDLRFLAIQLAVLSDSLGSSGLRSFAEDVRRQWPLARVLIIGAAQFVLDDPLYDEAVQRRISSADLLAALIKLSCYSFSQRVEVFRLNPGSIIQEESFEHSHRPAPVESDPTKHSDYDTETKEEPQDLPAEEHRDWRAV